MVKGVFVALITRQRENNINGWDQVAIGHSVLRLQNLLIHIGANRGS